MECHVFLCRRIGGCVFDLRGVAGSVFHSVVMEGHVFLCRRIAGSVFGFLRIAGHVSKFVAVHRHSAASGQKARQDEEADHDLNKNANVQQGGGPGLL